MTATTAIAASSATGTPIKPSTRTATAPDTRRRLPGDTDASSVSVAGPQLLRRVRAVGGLLPSRQRAGHGKPRRISTANRYTTGSRRIDSGGILLAHGQPPSLARFRIAWDTERSAG